jgi:hypothetical protein
MEQNIGQYETLEPALGPFEGNEEPTQDEIDSLDDVIAEVLTFIHGPNHESVLGSITNAPEEGGGIFKPIGNATFQILLATKAKFEEGGKKLPPAVLFGEGGAIHTTVDELFQMAQAAGVPGADDDQQYSASIMETLRLAGDYIEKTGDDASITEAQELLIDVEATAPGERQLGGGAKDDDLKAAIQRSLDAQNQTAPDAEQAPPQQPQPLPQGPGIAPDPNAPPPAQDPNAPIAPQQGGVLNV